MVNRKQGSSMNTPTDLIAAKWYCNMTYETWDCVRRLDGLVNKDQTFISLHEQRRI